MNNEECMSEISMEIMKLFRKANYDETVFYSALMIPIAAILEHRFNIEITEYDIHEKMKELVRLKTLDKLPKEKMPQC